MRDETPVMHYKTKGANRNHQNQIRRLAAKGYTVEEISDQVRVEEACVARFVESFEPEPEESKPEPVSKKKVSKKKD